MTTQAETKLVAEWFWIDRWMGSSAFLLPMEARGLYREMLTQAWRRGARLPNDHEAIQRAVGATAKEWSRAWPRIEKFWRVDGDTLVNDTQLQIYAEAQARQVTASRKAKSAALARHGHRPSTTTSTAPSTAQALPEHMPPSPSPSPSPDQTRAHALTGSGPMAGTLPRDHLRHAWCSHRGKCVPEFLHGQFMQAIGGDRGAADVTLRAFYEQTQAGWPPGPIGDAPVRLWERAFAAGFPSVAPTGRPVTVESGPPKGCRHQPACRDAAACTERRVVEMRGGADGLHAAP